MDRYTTIFVTDQRQQCIGEFLTGKNQQLKIKNDLLGEHCELEKILRNSERIVLPTPVLKLDRYKSLKNQVMQMMQVSREEGLLPDLVVYGGKFSREWTTFFDKFEIRYIDFMKDSRVVLANAKVTAEATVAELISAGGYSIAEEKYLVTGYGNCARAVAKRLAALGAKVTILARSPVARKQAKEDGYHAEDFSFGPEEAYGTRGIVNTVPALVLTETILKELHKDTVIIDIASAPGGTDLAAAGRCNITVKAALGLPGKYMPKTSAKILADCIRNHTLPLPAENGILRKEEEKSWIFQIII